MNQNGQNNNNNNNNANNAAIARNPAANVRNNAALALNSLGVVRGPLVNYTVLSCPPTDVDEIYKLLFRYVYKLMVDGVPQLNFCVVAMVGLWARLKASRDVCRRASRLYNAGGDATTNNWMTANFTFVNIMNRLFPDEEREFTNELMFELLRINTDIEQSLLEQLMDFSLIFLMGIIAKDPAEEGFPTPLLTRWKTHCSYSNMINEITELSLGITPMNKRELINQIPLFRYKIINLYYPLWITILQIEEEDEYMKSILNQIRLLCRFTRMTKILEVERLIFPKLNIEGFFDECPGLLTQIENFKDHFERYQASQGNGFPYSRVFDRNSLANLEMGNYPILNELLNKLIQASDTRRQFIVKSLNNFLISVETPGVIDIVKKIRRGARRNREN